MKNIITLFSLSFLFFAFQCAEDEQCEPDRLISTIDINISPYKLKYSLGDTIWLAKDLDTNFSINSIGENIDISNGSLSIELFILQLTGTPDIERGYEDFVFTNQKGSINQDAFTNVNIRKCTGTLEFVCDSTYCKLQTGIVPKAKGRYSIALGIGGVSIANPAQCTPQNRLESNTFNVDSFNREVYEDFGSGLDLVRFPWSTGVRNWGLENEGTFSFIIE